MPTIRRRPKHLAGFVLDRGRLSIPDDDFFKADPVRLIELFALAARERLEIHPSAMRAATRDARLIGAKVRKDPRANALFLEVLTNLHAPDLVLRWMNEAGVFGRFIPDFGRVVAQMQFDMYHHYTVDEHAIRAIGLLAAIERGELAEDHPLSTALFRQIASRRVLYVAVLLHDIAKGRGGDHSVLGEQVALELCPRLGLDSAETETVAWLVRHHLLMSATAFKRDLADPKTIEDFVRQVQSPERLRLLLMLTVVDIRAVGPGVWNEWKRLLLRTLFDAAEERLRLGHKQRGRSEVVVERQEALAARAGLEAEGRAGLRPAPARQLLAGRAARRAARQCAAGRAARKRASASRRRASSPSTSPTAPRRGSACSRPTAKACSSAFAPASPRRARASSTRGCTPRATAWRSTICWSRTRRAAPMPTSGCATGWSRAVEAALTQAQPPALPKPKRLAATPFQVAPSVDRCRARSTPDDGGRGQCARPARPAGAAGAGDPRVRPHASIRRISPPMASARSTSST